MPGSASPRRSVTRAPGAAAGRGGRNRASVPAGRGDGRLRRHRPGGRRGEHGGLTAGPATAPPPRAGSAFGFSLLLLLLLDHPLEMLGNDPAAHPLLLPALPAPLAGQGVALPELPHAIPPEGQQVAQRRLDDERGAAGGAAARRVSVAHEVKRSSRRSDEELAEGAAGRDEPSRQLIRPRVSWNSAGVDASRSSSAEAAADDAHRPRPRSRRQPATKGRPGPEDSVRPKKEKATAAACAPTEPVQLWARPDRRRDETGWDLRGGSSRSSEREKHRGTAGARPSSSFPFSGESVGRSRGLLVLLIASATVRFWMKKCLPSQHKE